MHGGQREYFLRCASRRLTSRHKLEYGREDLPETKLGAPILSHAHDFASRVGQEAEGP